MQSTLTPKRHLRSSKRWSGLRASFRDLSAAHLDAHGVAPAAFTLGSTTDAPTYLNDFGIPALCFGAVAHDMHGIDESVELQSIVAAARTLARFLLMRFGTNEVPQ